MSTVTCDYLVIQDSAATGGATWYAGSHSVSVSGNSGWTFTDAPAQSGGSSGYLWPRRDVPLRMVVGRGRTQWTYDAYGLPLLSGAGRSTCKVRVDTRSRCNVRDIKADDVEVLMLFAVQRGRKRSVS